MGIKAEDYDIQNNFGETDHIIDLFDEIRTCYSGAADTVFDRISEDDLVIAFFPCIYFCATSQMAFSLGYTNYRKLSFQDKIEKIIERSEKREEFYKLLIMMIANCEKKNIRLIVENPWSEQTFLKNSFLKSPDLVDTNRMMRGDYFKKPTAYWYWNCTATYGESYQNDKEQKTIMHTKQSSKAGICSEDRSMISPDYARNFIHDFIIGKEQTDNKQITIFDYML
jgi:hypothetical protein